MGNCCCRNESPCGSVEERSVLLKDDSKTTVTSVKNPVVGTCGPGGDSDDIRKTPSKDSIKEPLKAKVAPVKQGDEAPEKELNNTENGPLQKDNSKTATASPEKGSETEENSTVAQNEDVKKGPDSDEQPEIQHCTLNCPDEEHATADREVTPATKAANKEENPASAEDKVPDRGSIKAEAACPEKLSETNTTEHTAADSPPDNDEETGSKVTTDTAAAEPSGEISQNNEELSVPNTQQPPAAESRGAPVPVDAQDVSKETQKESTSCAVTEDSQTASACREDDPEVTPRSHDASESSPPGHQPTGLDHSEELRSANSVRESETTAPAESSESSKPDHDANPDRDPVRTSSKEVTTVESMQQEEGIIVKEQDKDGEDPDLMEEDKTEKEVVEDAEVQEEKEEEKLTESTPTDVKAEEAVKLEREGSPEDSLANSEEDLYRGAEELPSSQKILMLEDRCSLAPAVDILSYSEREWKGNTAKSALIRKGYKEMSQRFGSLRRVRGDNYCALRATLYQVLSHSTELPAWLQDEDITMLPKQLEAQEGLISQWTFPGECLQGDGTDAITQLKGYMELLKNKWQAALDCSSALERQQLCERVFQGGEEELGLLEALKLLMLSRAVELHGLMQAGGDVPLFCWLLFARDSSDCPRSFLSNHLSHVGLSAGLEQVEMFLLGYALHCTIQVYRLYKADTEEFVTYYPDDHKDDWLSVCLVTEDDRHYNVPVVEAPELQKELDSS